MVMTNPDVHQQTQSEIDQQWEIIGLYCVFVFKKTGNLRYRDRPKFDNIDLRREIINIKNWD